MEAILNYQWVKLIFSENNSLCTLSKFPFYLSTFKLIWRIVKQNNQNNGKLQIDWVKCNIYVNILRYFGRKKIAFCLSVVCINNRENLRWPHITRDKNKMNLSICTHDWKMGTILNDVHLLSISEHWSDLGQSNLEVSTWFFKSYEHFSWLYETWKQ
jgi:hypothetical protein